MCGELALVLAGVRVAPGSDKLGVDVAGMLPWSTAAAPVGQCRRKSRLLVLVGNCGYPESFC